VAAAYRDKCLKKTQIYAIINNNKEGKPTTDQRKLHGRRKVRKPEFITNVAADIKKDRCVTVRKLDLVHGVSKNTIHKDLNL
jgi:hypothetical protein